MWAIFAFLAAISSALLSLFIKKEDKRFNIFVVSWASCFYSLILLLPTTFLMPLPELDITFWIAFVVQLVISTIAGLLYTQALKESDLSLTLPMLAFSPLFLLGSGWILNKEFPSPLGLVGVLLIVIGAYTLHFKPHQKNLLQPFKAACCNRGSLYMLIVAAIWGVTGGLDKLIILHSNAYFYATVGSLASLALLTPFVIMYHPRDFVETFKKKYISQFVIIGLLSGVIALTELIAQSQAYSVYVISIKRTSIIFGALLGWYFFHEKISHRIIPIMIMIAGVILIAVGS